MPFAPRCVASRCADRCPSGPRTRGRRGWGRLLPAVAGGLLALAAVGTVGPGQGRAQRPRAVIGILDPVAGQAEARDLARDLGGTLRWEARRVRGWTVLSKALDPVGQRRAHRCGVLDDVCLLQIARALSADAVVYGEASITRATRCSVFLGYFDRRRGRTTRSVVDTFPRVDADVDALRPRARRYLRVLAGQVTARDPGLGGGAVGGGERRRLARAGHSLR